MANTGYYTSSGLQITRAAYYAILAAKMMKSIGKYAAQQFAIKNGSTMHLFRMALQLQVVENG